MTFWDNYPNKKGKQAAFKKWQNITKTTTPSLLIEGVKKFAKAMEGTEKKYIKHPTTWLNAGSWDDDHTNTPPEQELSRDQRWMNSIPFITDEEDDR